MTQEQNASLAQAVQMLTAQLGAAKVLSSGPAYDVARHVWNAAVTRRPAVIVLCESTGDVQSSVRAARTCGLSLSVRGVGVPSGENWSSISPGCGMSALRVEWPPSVAARPRWRWPRRPIPMGWRR